MERRKIKDSTMRLGKVKVNLEYVVDLDNEAMVVHAKDSLVEDIYSAVKNNEVDWLVVTIPDCKDVSESDILEFLKEQENEE